MFAFAKYLCHYTIDQAAFDFVIFLLHASSYFINGRTSWNPSLNCDGLLGIHITSMEKQETFGDLPANSRAEEGDLKPVVMPHNEQEWPTDWRAYAAYFAGFCGMALC